MYGLGTDIIEIARIEQAIANPRFLRHVFTEEERRWLASIGKNRAASAAGLYCAKEAIAKAVGTGFGETLRLQDIEITHDALGAPKVRLPHPQFLLSISHCRTYATATAILLAPPGEKGDGHAGD